MWKKRKLISIKKTSEWRDTPLPNIVNYFVNIIGIIILLFLIISIIWKNNASVYFLAIIVIPIFLIFNIIFSYINNIKEKEIRSSIIDSLAKIDDACIEGNIGDFEWELFSIGKNKQKTKDPYMYTFLKLLQRSEHVGLSETIRPQIFRLPETKLKIAEQILDLKTAVEEENYSKTLIAFGGLFNSYIGSIQNQSHSSDIVLLKVKRELVKTLQKCKADLLERRIGLAIGRLNNLNSDFIEMDGSVNDNYVFVIINWLLKKMRELEKVKPRDFHIIWLSRFEQLAIQIEETIQAYQEKNSMKIMQIMVDSYDYSSKRLKFFSRNLY